VTGPIDFVLVDVWVPVALPALKRLVSHLRRGAVVICDNTTLYRDAYAEYLDFVTESNGFTTMTLPFEGGLEFSVWVGSSF
jgi:predicted O-methyltransferase YrrM